MGFDNFSFRTIVCFKAHHRLCYLYGYAKHRRATISRHELRAYQRYAQYLLALSDTEVEKLITQGELVEIKYE